VLLLIDTRQASTRRLAIHDGGQTDVATGHGHVGDVHGHFGSALAIVAALYYWTKSLARVHSAVGVGVPDQPSATSTDTKAKSRRGLPANSLVRAKSSWAGYTTNIRSCEDSELLNASAAAAYARNQTILRTTMPVADVIRRIGISERTFYRWKKQYADLQSDQVRELKRLQDENAG
jgi:hypothetical protein